MSLANKKTQNLTRIELKKLLSVARGDTPPDVLIKNVRILDLINGGIIENTSIAISGKYIAGTGPEYLNSQAHTIIDANNNIAVPGFIDGHLHIESSMMNPFEFECMTLPLGTTTAICDPHEITNVLGESGFSWFLRCSELMNQNLFVQTSSCVPAVEGLETNGGEFKLSQMKSFKEHPNVLGLAEMMNFPGVINGDDMVLDKLEAFSDLNLDGHSPLLRGKALNAYLAAGIQNCHETITQDEGLEKLQKGMSLILREGSVAKNLKTLSPLVNEFNSIQCLLCTDDRNPYEIKKEGHINFLIKKLINELNMPVHLAYRLATYSAAKHMGLKRLGLLAPGKIADIVLISNLKEVKIEKVFSAGTDVSQLNLEALKFSKIKKSNPPLNNSINRKKLVSSDLKFELTKGKFHIIEIIPDEIITKHSYAEFDGKNFNIDDIAYMVNVERYGQNLGPAKGLVKGFNIKSGAIAASVAHDSHNLLSIGKSTEDMTIAINSLIDAGGGLCVVKDNKVKAILSLPIAGLISMKSGDELYEELKKLKLAFKELGITLDEPFIQMAFLALPVIPSIKLTDKGLFDVEKFQYISLRKS
jgi:adenine deaminase